MAAIAGVLHTFLSSGDHVVFVNQTYGPTLALARRLRRFGVLHDLALDLDPAAVAGAITPETRILWIESRGRCCSARSTPLFQKPLLAGVDLVVHSATKYLGGHSDLLAGAVAGRAELMERVFEHGFMLLGGLLASSEAWLLNRGLRTLPARMRRHHTGALEVARFLSGHPAVRRVFHPDIALGPGLGLGSGPGGLSGFSGLFSFELEDGSYDRVRAVVDRLQRFRIGVSWGGVESLVLAPFRGDNAEALEALRIPAGTIRLSIGLEPPESLIEDLDHALRSA